MFVADPLYGAFRPPSWLADVLLTPEVQRLRGVRLINTSSPSLAALSDARRYTHTLGVLRLALVVDASLASNFRLLDRQAFLASIVIHDVGTPPFGHIFEYLLAATFGWSHEDMVESILRGTYRPENRYHQILPGRQLGLARALERHGIDPETVAGLVRGKGPLGSLVSGSIDLDNIDNVWRMASLLGLPAQPSDAMALAERMSADEHGILFSADAARLLGTWAKTRSSVYRVLAFDDTNLKGQAMLSDCLTLAMENHILGEEHWWWTDELLLYKLNESKSDIKDVVQRFLVGDLYETIFLGWYSVPQDEHDLRRPENRRQLRDALEAEIGIPCSPYVFYDNGTFRKRIQVRVGESEDGGRSCDDGVTSRSTIIGVYTPRADPSRSLRVPARQVLTEFGFPEEALIPIPTQNEVYGLPGQEKLPI